MEGEIAEEKREIFSIAERYLEQKFYGEALHLAESWLKRFPFDTDAVILRCRALLKLGKLKEVQEILNDVDSKINQLSRVYHCVGDICREAGLHSEAGRFYRKFILHSEDHEEVERVREKLQILEAAMPSLREVEEGEVYSDLGALTPDFYTLTLADLYIGQGHYDLALQVLREILKKDEKNLYVAEKIAYVQSMMQGKERNEEMGIEKRKEEVIQKLSRWLANAERMRTHAS